MPAKLFSTHWGHSVDLYVFRIDQRMIYRSLTWLGGSGQRLESLSALLSLIDDHEGVSNTVCIVVYIHSLYIDIYIFIYI